MDPRVRIQKTKRVLACLAGALALVTAAGCGTSSEKVIVSSTARPVIDKQARVSGLPLSKSVDCPQTKPETGATFTCDATLKDGTAYEMTIRIDKAGAERPLLTVVRSQLTTVGPATVKPLIDEQIRETHAPAAKTITCQHAAATVGNTFTCKVILVDGHVVTDAFRVLKVPANVPAEFSIKTLSIE